MFAYVAGCCLIFSLLFYKWSRLCRRTVWIYGLSLLICTPCLIYTYSLTGRFFYWSTKGGTALYWMTTPCAKEYGDYKNPNRVLTDERLSWHRELFEKLEGLNYVERDKLLRREAFSNIRNYPLKYCFNWVSNVGRMWYAYPYSYKYQRPHTLFYMVPNSILLTSLLLCCYPLVKCRENLPGELVMLIGFVVIFLAGSSLINAGERYIKPVVPIFIIVIFFTVTNLLQIHLLPQRSVKFRE